MYPLSSRGGGASVSWPIFFCDFPNANESKVNEGPKLHKIHNLVLFFEIKVVDLTGPGGDLNYSGKHPRYVICSI